MPVFHLDKTIKGEWSIHIGLVAAGAAGGTRLRDYGLQNGVLHRENLGVDTLTFDRVVPQFDAAPPIAYGQIISLVDWKGTVRFVGRRVVVPGMASGPSESQQWVFHGPWDWLARTVYRQTWQQLLINGALATRATSHLLLNVGARQSCADQIEHVVQLVIDEGAPIQIGTIDIAPVPFSSEITDQTCAQVISDQLRFAPNAVAWFDYSTNPPTFHCRATLTTVLLTFGPEGVPPITQLNIMARPDLAVEKVALRYERTDTLNGVEYLALGEDLYPPGNNGSGLNAINATITLAGGSRTTVSAAILCDTINTASLEFWKKLSPRLRNTRIKNLAFHATPNIERKLRGSRTDANPSGTNSSAYARRLVEGQLVAWMRDATDNQLDWEQEELSCDFTFEMDTDASSGVKLEKVEKIRITIELVSTNAPDGVSEYSDVTAEEEAELQPVGLAQYLYLSMANIDYEGSLQTTQQECSGFIGPGNTLNIAGTHDGNHQEMFARVQSVDESIDSGVTSIRFGPAPHLSLANILEFLRATRHRRRWTRTSVQEDGENASNATVELGEAMPNDNNQGGDKHRSLFACQSGTKRVELDAANKTATIIDSAVAGVYAIGSTTATVSQWVMASGAGSATLKANAGQAECTIVGAGGRIDAWSSLCQGQRLFPREEVWCDPTTGARRRIMVLCSAPYGTFP